MLPLSLTLGLLLAAVLADRYVVGTRHAQAISESRQFAADLATQMGREHAAHRAEVQTLLQRIQAPQVAVMQHVDENATDPGTSLPLDDAESVEAANAAFALEADAAIAAMVQHENEIHGLIAGSA